MVEAMRGGKRFIVGCVFYVCPLHLDCVLSSNNFANAMDSLKNSVAFVDYQIK